MRWNEETDRLLARRDHPSSVFDARRLFNDLRRDQVEAFRRERIRRRRLDAALSLAIVATGVALFAGLGVWIVGVGVVTLLMCVGWR